MYIYTHNIIRQFSQKSLANEGIIGDHIKGLLRIFLNLAPTFYSQTKYRK